jgi:alpha-1,6-mannosyltransferase
LGKRAALLADGCALGAAMAVATAAARHSEITEHSPISPAGGWKDAWTLALIAAFVLYLAGLALAHGLRNGTVAVAAIALAIQLIPLAGPLLLSTDVYSYWDYGRLAAVHDVNPYETLPSEFPHDPAYELMGSDWQNKRTVYGPLFTFVSEGHARIVGESPNRAARLYRLLAALAMCVLVVLIAWRTRSVFATVFVGWSPLLALHFGGGGHNDVLMALGLVGALLLAASGRRHAEGAAWVVASAIKIVPLVLLPLRLLETRRAFGYRGLLAAAAAVSAAAFVLYDWHWLTIFTPVANQLRSSSSLGLPYWAAKIGIPEGFARLALLIGFAVAYVWLALRAVRGRAHLALAVCLLLLATAWLQPWYAVWAVPLAALDDDWRPRALALLLSAYFLRDALPI